MLSVLCSVIIIMCVLVYKTTAPLTCLFYFCLSEIQLVALMLVVLSLSHVSSSEFVNFEV